MTDILKLTLESREKRGLTLILTRDEARQAKTELIARLILSGPLFVLSGDEWLPSFELPRLIRERTTGIRQVMDRLYSARAATCHRLFDSLASIPSKGEPILAIEFLHTFYDADVPLRLRLFRLRECCRELRRLAFYRPVMVMMQELAAEEYEKFLPAVYSISDKVLRLEPELEQVKQPVLF